MKYLDKNATTLVIDLENGFAYASDDSELENYFQACLIARKDGNGYTKQISRDDCGWNDGICGDYNDSIGACNHEHFDEFLTLARRFGVLVR